jgi:lipoprotein-anchoring transpeptidase ErfK/SrfK
MAVRTESPRRLLIAIGVAAVLLAVVAAAGVLTGRDEVSADGDPVPGVDGAPGSSTTTTTQIVVREVLPAGTREVATALPSVRELQVRAEAPSGWDRDLSPVVTSADPPPPRSAQDVQRVELPTPEEPIVGRRATATGWLLSNPTPYQPPQPLVLGVVERQGDWIQVQLPVRPNGTTGWVRARDVELSSTTRSIRVSLSERRVQLVDAGAVLLDVPAGIGRPTTPTPTGWFTVTDIVPSANPDGGYGPVALALDGYSEAMDSFAGESGGDTPDAKAPVLAIHGTNRPSSVGAEQSNGCPRLFNDDMVRLAQLTPAGTPVFIWP